MSQTLINHDQVALLLKKRINEEMRGVAEPIIEQAMMDIRQAMINKLGSIAVSLVEKRTTIDRFGDDLRIIIDHREV